MKSVNKESREIEELFKKLCNQPIYPFPSQHQKLDAPPKHGVYVIRRGEIVLHVGRTLRGKNGLYQRLSNHLHGASSFTIKFLNGDGSILRNGKFTHQYLELENPRKRALLEAYAIGMLCPTHIGLGE